MIDASARRLRAALPLLAMLCIAAAPAAPAASPAENAGALSAAVSSDVAQSYRLLTTTYYSAVDAQALLAAAADALADAAKKEGATIAPAQLKASPDTETTMAQLDAAIVAAAAAAHASPTAFAYVAIGAMAHAIGDRYTQFFTPDEFKAFNEALDPERISGIGVMIEPDVVTGFTRISFVVPGTPADRAGLHNGDEIQSVDGTSTKGLLTDAVSKLLRGKTGSVTNLLVLRGSDTTPQAMAITREQVQPPTVVFKMLPGEIGWVYVLAFGRATPAEFDTAVGRLREQGAKALVLDLRNDGGGYVDSALDISSRFIANKPLVTVEERGSHSTTIDADGNASIAFPVTVLVNQFTASASEITAGALQDDGIASLVGAKTFGKGVMQTLTPLPDGAAIKITTAHYLTPSRRDINLRGIEPDVRVDEPHDARFGDLEKDPQLRAAIAELQKKIAATTPKAP
jgi:carboxyl-terminal processing protease